MLNARLMPRTVVALAVAASVALGACGRNESPAAVIERAQQSVQKRETRASELELRSLLQTEPDNPKARLWLGRINLANADFRGAEKELQRALELGVTPDEAGPWLIEAIFQSGEYQQAIDQARTVAVTTPAARAEIANTIGRALMAQQKNAEAKRKFDEALSLVPDHVPTLASIIGWRALTGDRAGARTEVETLVKRHADSPDLLVMRGDLDLSDGKLEAARESFAKVVELTPMNLVARAKLSAILIDLKDWEPAEKQLGELRRLAGGSAGTSHLIALYEYRRGKLEPALVAVQAALKNAPDYLPALALGASVAMQLNQLDTAERYARQVVDKAPQSEQGQRLLGTIYLRMNVPERAQQVVKPLLDKGSNDAGLLSIAGEAALRLNDPQRAAALFERAAKSDPRDAAKRTGLALSRFATGERDKALSDLEAAVELDSQAYQADFALIMARVREKQYDKALEAVARFEQKQPRNPVAHNLRGMVHVARDDAASARKAFEAAMAADPTFFPAAANLATLDLRDKKPDAARARYEKLLQVDPRNMSALIALARHAQLHGGSREQVLGFLREAQKQNPGAVQPAVAMASYQLELDKPREAILTLQDALATNRDRTELLELLGTAYLRANERQQAVEIYERMVRSNPRSAPLHFRLGELRANLGDIAGATTSFRRAAELQPGSAEPRIAQATMLLRAGRKQEARAVADALKKDLPNSSAGAQLEADLLSADDKHAEAAALYRKLFEEKKTAQIGAKYYMALSRAGRDADADAFLKRWRTMSPDDITVLMYAGEMKLSMKRWQPAADLFREALRKDPRNIVAMNNAAWALHQLKDPQAAELAERAYDAAPQQPAVIDTFAVILKDRGNARRATDLLRQAVALAPRVPDYRLHLAQALAATGDGDEARNEVQSLLREHPRGNVAEQARALAATLPE